ncbi:MAG: ubiquitin-like protein Pup [Candidatus Rokuibacteriota bacterium]
MAQPTRQTKAEPRSTRPAEQVDERASVGHPELTKKGEEIAGKLDDLLDEIDEVLEENAEDFVKSYIQRGGQ